MNCPVCSVNGVVVVMDDAPGYGWVCPSGHMVETEGI